MTMLPTGLFFLVLASAPLEAQSPVAMVEAPPMQSSRSIEQRDFGVWDDVILCDDQDVVLLRRESDLFALSMSETSRPSKLLTASALEETEGVTCASSGERLWAFLQSRRRAPFAIEVCSGQVAEFKIPGVRVPGNQAPTIQSHVVIQHADAAIVMVAGGDGWTWPRDGNRSMYFWMSLKSGEVIAFPAGWDLEYFSADQLVAVFAKPQVHAHERRPLQAVDVKSGAFVSELPDRRLVDVVPFAWTDTRPVKALYARRADTGDVDHWKGISIDGSVYPLAISDDDAQYMANAKVNDDWAGIRFRHEGVGNTELSLFWVTGLSQDQKPELVATSVTDFAMLASGSCVFASSGHGHNGRSSEAFVRQHKDKSQWNVLDGVERLPDLPPAFVDKPYVNDSLDVQFIDGIGSRTREPLVLALFTQTRADMRALVPPVEEPQLTPTAWRRGVLLTADGRRSMTELFQAGELSDAICLYKSGRVLLFTYSWDESERPPWQGRTVHLFETTLQLPWDARERK